jgi:hypothetical protein
MQENKRTKVTLTSDQWFKEAHRRYPDKNFVFVCPVCHFKQSYDDYVKAKAKPGQIGFICIGRLLPKCREAFGEDHKKDGPCNYTGGGLFGLNPVTVTFGDGDSTDLFDFADEPLLETWEQSDE